MTLLAAINWHSVLFLLFALLACGFAVAVLAAGNIVRMAFYLTLSLGATAGLFFLAGAEFVGAMQLMIYVGGTLVLLIFGVMLTAQARFISMKTSAGEWILGMVVGAALFGVLIASAFSVQSWYEPRTDLQNLTLADGKTSTPVGLALTGVRVDKLTATSDRQRAGMSGYLLPFVIISMHLLIVLIGAGYMARTKRLATGALLERPAATAPRERRRPFFVATGLVKGIIINLVLAALCFYLAARPIPATGEGAPANAALRWIAETLAAAPGWLLPLLGALFVVNVLLLLVTWSWQKWGVVGLVLVPVVQAMAIGNAGLGPLLSIAWLAVTLLPVIVLIGLLTTGRRPTMWSQME